MAGVVSFVVFSGSADTTGKGCPASSSSGLVVTRDGMELLQDHPMHARSGVTGARTQVQGTWGSFAVALAGRNQVAGCCRLQVAGCGCRFTRRD